MPSLAGGTVFTKGSDIIPASCSDVELDLSSRPDAGVADSAMLWL